ncbi:MAG TPA: hypothetical protein VE753_03040 [Gaiellaceae bacterium]|jgi:hypothetical protein|nr:hypothetical protein [Gaiellaceae bacterium]
MRPAEDVWIPLVDEPIGTIVREIQAQDPAINLLVDSPRKLLTFRTFAYIRVGILLGRLLVESDLEPSGGKENWADELLQDPRYHEQVVREVRAVAEEIAGDPAYAAEPPVGPDEDARERFLEFAKRRLAADS